MIIDEYINGLTLPDSFNTGIIADYLWENNLNDSSGNNYHATNVGTVGYESVNNIYTGYAVYPVGESGITLPTEVKLTTNTTIMFPVLMNPLETGSLYAMGGSASGFNISKLINPSRIASRLYLDSGSTGYIHTAAYNSITEYCLVLASVDFTTGFYSINFNNSIKQVKIPTDSSIVWGTATRNLFGTNNMTNYKIGRLRIWNKAFQMNELEQIARYFYNKYLES